MTTDDGWEHFSHEADMGVRGWGPSLEQAFEQIAVAMINIITDSPKIAADEEVEIHCQAPDTELLLVDWLNAIIFEMATRKLLLSRFQVSLQDTQLQAKAWGEKVDPKKHHPAVEVKGATYTQLSVKQEPTRGWVAQCVVDV